MKIIKNVLIAIMILVIVLVITNANAYTGGVVDAGDEIEISAVLNNGNAIVTTSTSLSNSTMYYQFVEMDSTKYNQIRKLKDELNVAVYYRINENNPTEQNYDNYISALNYYQTKYGETLTNFRDSHIEELKAQIIGNLPDYTNNWILTSNNTISLDLSNFSGTKYYTAWVKVQKDTRTVYDAQIYDVTGTKTNSSESNNTNTGNNTNQNTGVVDAGDEIGMPVLAADGTGIVELANNITNYQMYYQINEIEASKYNEIRKLKDELNVAVYFRTYENDQTEQNYDNYISARQYYLNKYRVELTGLSDARIEELKAQIKGLLPRYTDNWISTTNNKVDANLSSFSGTKDFVMWVKVVSGDRTIYDGDIYELTGTKQETPVTPTTPSEDDKPTTPTTPSEDDEPTTPTTPSDNDKPATNPSENDKPSNSTTSDNKDENKQETPTTSDKDNNKQDNANADKNQQSTTTSNNDKPATNVGNSTTSSKELPYTGKSDIIIIGTIVMSIGLAFITYSKLKEI